MNGIVFKPLLTPAVITADFEGMKRKLDDLLQPYQGLDAKVVSEMSIKDAKTCRADLNAMSRQLNDARKEIKRAYEAPLKDFEGEIRELDDLIQVPAKMLDEAIKAKEAEQKEERRAALEQTYLEFAPALAKVVPFDQILESQWLNKSFGEKKAENAMCDKVAAIAKDWEVLKATELRVSEATEAEFFRTLSLQDALAYDKREAEEQDRIASMKEEIESYQHTEPETEPESEPKPNPKKGYVVVFEATESQWEAVRSVLVASDIHGNVVTVDNAQNSLERVREVLA